MMYSYCSAGTLRTVVDGSALFGCSFDYWSVIPAKGPGQ
jgi:hypothetical protein